MLYRSAVPGLNLAWGRRWNMTIIVNKCKGFGVRHSYYLTMWIYSYYCKSMFVYEFMIRKLVFSWYTFPIHKYSQILHIDDWIWRNENYIYLCTPAWPNLLFMECILSKGLIPGDSMINWKRSCFLGLNLTILPPRGSHWPSGICWLATNSSSAPAANMGAGVGTEKLNIKYRTVQMCRYIYTQ